MKLTAPAQLARLVGLVMLTAATVIFLYYTVWTLLMVLLYSLMYSLVLTMVFPSPLWTKITPYMLSSLHVSGQSEYLSFSSWSAPQWLAPSHLS
jgi:Dolichol phosphate-mannose biosynthesis regulatory protein (DPM2)